MQMKMSYIIGNKKCTNKRKCTSLCKRTLYLLQSTAAKKENICKTKQKAEERYVTKLKKIYLKIENSKISLIKRGTYENV